MTKNGLNWVDKTFISLHSINLLDFFLETTKEYFRKKYNIDYLAIHMVHENRSCLIGAYDQDDWHEYLYENNIGMNEENLINICSKIDGNELYLEYFDTNMKTRDINKRADIFSIRKYGGCGLILTDELKNITVYDVTFKDDSAFETLNKNVLFSIIKDLTRYKSLLLPFINHANKFGNFEDIKILGNATNEFIEKNSSLFYF
jgi:hypothetical protein